MEELELMTPTAGDGPRKRENSISSHSSSLRPRGLKPLRKLTPAQTAELGRVLEWLNDDDSTGSDGSQDVDDCRSSVDKPHFIHATPYHKDGLTSLFIAGSSTYAQLVIVVCIVSVMTQVVKSKSNAFYSEVFFTYLYSVAIIFFLYIFGYLLRRKKMRKQKRKNRQRRKNQAVVTPKETNGDPTAAGPDVALVVEDSKAIDSNQSPESLKQKKIKVSESQHSHVSFFLRAGAVAFGLGTVIYDGLEFGAFLELPKDSPCFFLLKGINPILHAAFAFFQMYFIYVSARLNIHRFKAIARFGLMHCVATNVCVWIRTLVRESLKEIREHFLHGADKTSDVSHDAAASHHHTDTDDTTTYNETITEIGSHFNPSIWNGTMSCGRRVFLGNFISDAAPFLYPFLIEYSLIGAAVLYVLWANIGVDYHRRLDRAPFKFQVQQADHEGYLSSSSHSRHELRVDCSNSQKGLFGGLFFLTVCLLSLVLFLVFVPQPELRQLGLFMADATHCALLLVSIIAMAIGIHRARVLDFHPAAHTEELGSILLRVSAIGIFTYSVFSIMAGALSPSSAEEPPVLVLITGLLTATEVAAQMLFISDMSRRRVGNAEHDQSKPGRQTVIFLLIINLASWLVYTFEVQKSEANPVQLNFYGFLPWAVVQRLTLPLCIFYRFHSVIVHAEIWKNTYRFEN